MRPIQEIFNELLNHPDCLDARYFSKNDEWDEFVEMITDEADEYEEFDLEVIKEYYNKEGYGVLKDAIHDNIIYGWEHSDPLYSVLTDHLIEKGYLKYKND